MALKVLIMAIIIVVAVVVIALIILSRIAHTLHAPSVEWCLRLASEHAHGCFLKQPNTQSQLMYGAKYGRMLRAQLRFDTVYTCSRCSTQQ